jgi:hypothetical protein
VHGNGSTEKEGEFYTPRSAPVFTRATDQNLIDALKALPYEACGLFCSGYPHAAAQRM